MSKILVFSLDEPQIIVGKKYKNHPDVEKESNQLFGFVKYKTDTGQENKPENNAIVCAYPEEWMKRRINNLVDKMEMKTIRWQQDIVSDFVDDVTKDGKKVKRLSITKENSPMYELRVVGEKVDPWFLFDKLLRDFFQYTMNAFDSISFILSDNFSIAFLSSILLLRIILYTSNCKITSWNDFK